MVLSILQIQLISFNPRNHLLKKILFKFFIPPGAHELESMNDESKRIIIAKGHYTEAEYPFLITANFKTLGSIIEKKPKGAKIGFVFDDSLRNLLGFRETMLFKGYNLSNNLVDILSFDNIFLGCDVAKGMLFKSKRYGIFHNWTMIVNPGYKYVKKFPGGVTCI